MSRRSEMVQASYRETSRLTEAQAARFYDNKLEDATVSVTQATNDGGKDFIAEAGDELIHGEVKHWKRPVSAYEMNRIIEHAKRHGVQPAYHSTSGFTEGACRLAEEHDVLTSTSEDLARSDRGQELMLRLWRNSIQKLEFVGEYAVAYTSQILRTVYMEAGKRITKRALRQQIQRFKQGITKKRVIGLAIVVIAVYVLYSHFNKDEEDDGPLSIWEK